MSRRFTVPDAAVALGITETAVRQRIGRHTLPTERVASRVYVVLPDMPVDMPPALAELSPAGDDTPTETPTDTPDTPPEAAHNRALVALERLLRDTLAEKDAAQQAAAMWMERSTNLRAEVDRLQGEVEALLALPAHEEPPPPWWRRWRR
jgi:hypothetical protein